MVATNFHGFLLDLIVGVLMNAENNGTQGTRGFIQIRASMRIKILHHVCIIVLRFFGLRPPLTLLL
jgi:hypothetical protein